MKETIHIGTPYVQQTESEFFGPAARLAADVTMTNPNTGTRETRPLSFEFERRFEQYLCTERSDAFVMGLLSSALELGDNIEFEAPMSEMLFYNLSDEYIPGITKYFKNFPIYPIKLIGPTTSALLRTGGGGGSSCRLLRRSRLSLHYLQKD